MTKSQNIASIEEATHKTWKEWTLWLDGKGAKDLDHTHIAKLVGEELEGKIESAGWWAQGVAVAYEQSIGRRKPGQRSDGSFEVSVSATFDGKRDAVFSRWLDVLEGVKDFDGKKIKNTRISTTSVRSYWRCDLGDGSKLTWSIEQKDPEKVLLVVSHAKLQQEGDGAKWRDFWKRYVR